MTIKSVDTLFKHVAGAAIVSGNDVLIVDEAKLPRAMDGLVETAVFGEGLVRDTARWLIWELAQGVGIHPSSIHELYTAIGRGDVPANFTVPAINIRAINYDTARAVFRAANKTDAGAILFEISRGEMAYTFQRPSEYASCVLAAALKEGYRGPVFIQGDHFQISASRYRQNPAKEVQAVKDLMLEAVEAGYYNIDIDPSTLVDLSFPTLDEQQTENYTLCASLTAFARSIEPEGVTLSLGGEIGEVGHKNSTVEELDAFMQGYLRKLPDGMDGISKISVQTGTSHGGVVLPDGTLADVKVDFKTLRDLSSVAREQYGMGGAVQHGASTLPAGVFGKFPEVGTLEIHLAANFMNIVYDRLPQELVDKAYTFLEENHSDEWQEGQTREQFVYQTRKKAIGQFKAEWWGLPEEKKEEIAAALQNQFEFLFNHLNVGGTREIVKSVTTMVEVRKERPLFATVEAATEDVSDLDD
ncbi:MAG: class II fructose-bisphosphate aldolase [Chloroflexota bacterium]